MIFNFNILVLSPGCSLDANISAFDSVNSSDDIDQALIGAGLSCNYGIETVMAGHSISGYSLNVAAAPEDRCQLSKAYCDGNSGALNKTIYSSCSEGSVFITEWSVAAGDTVEIQVGGYGQSSDYSFYVDWGDSLDISDNKIYESDSQITYTFSQAGDYLVTLKGRYHRVSFFSSVSSNNLKTGKQWGTNKWKSLSYMFTGARNLVSFDALDTPNMSEVVDMSYVFYAAEKFNGSISWNVCLVPTGYHSNFD